MRIMIDAKDFTIEAMNTSTYHWLDCTQWTKEKDISSKVLIYFNNTIEIDNMVKQLETLKRNIQVESQEEKEWYTDIDEAK